MLRALARLPFLAVRQLRWRKGAWSKDSDRQYHEPLYEAQDYDAFRTSYPGYVTIRRFADHAEVLMPGAGAVLDIGCGPGEITCELARRYPHLSFVGIDHSASAIRRATRNAARLGVTNIRFLVGSAEDLPADDRYGLVLMFDAFHHLEQPREFLAWLRTRTSRVVLIEPAGTWTGRWARNLDVDWLLDDLANIRDRLEAVAGETSTSHTAPPPGPGPGPASAGEAAATAAHAPLVQGEGAVERRYALDDFEDFFRGWQLRITGTVAGFDRYPPGPHAQSALRPATGDLAYALVCATEDLLLDRDRDGAAKHWVIAATTESGVLEPRLPGRTTAAVPARDLPPSRVGSAYDVRYQRYDGPTEAATGEEFGATIEIVNAGWDEWRSEGPQPVHVSYHWLKSNGGVLEFDGLRSDLPRALGSRETCEVAITIRAPSAAGDYTLAIDLVKEGVTWFSEAGKPWHSVRVSVTDR
jgi:SAM-dependent methyltransferase